MKNLLNQTLAVALLSTLTLNSKAQYNLVPNPSFEDTIFCPNNAGEINNALGWMSPTLGSPDYYNSCSSNYFSSVPNNWYGTQLAHLGNAYAGLYTFQGIYGNYREYIQIELNDSLRSNKKYFVQFYVSLSDTSMYSCSNVDAYFSNSQISYPLLQQNLPYSPQAKNDSSNILSDKIGWSLITDTFIAVGGEKYMTLGNFLTDSASSVFNVGGSNFIYAYYYIDDISVVSLDSINSVQKNLNDYLTVYPNPVSDVLRITFQKNQNVEIEIDDVIGKTIYRNVISDEKELTINFSIFSRGYYFLKIIASRNGNLLTKKIIKI